MQKLKRILALCGAVFLAGLYLLTFILGVFGNENTHRFLTACIVCTVIIPVLLYAMFLIARILDRRNRPQDQDPEDARRNSGK